MARVPPRRVFAELTYQEAAGVLTDRSILCLPLGATEQHGPHLPLNTDVVVAEGVTRRMVERWGDEFDLWQLPTVAIGLSREHDWASGTLSLSIASFTALLGDIARDVTRTLPTRNIAIVNGHGGNRGALDVLLHELRSGFGINGCAIHPFDLAGIGNDAASADVHGGRNETSVMLALAPKLVRRDLIARGAAQAQGIQSLIFDRGVSWPWRTDDVRIARDGIIGDPSGASIEHGEAIIAAIVDAAGAVFARLLEHGRLMPRSAPPPG
jgi:creatinine amidohydrolase/Fe(II)-dependent formamide hydrolase-like protein